MKEQLRLQLKITHFRSTFDPVDDEPCTHQIQKKIEEKFAKAAYSSFQYLDSIVNEHFQYEFYLISMFLLMHLPI